MRKTILRLTALGFLILAPSTGRAQPLNIPGGIPLRAAEGGQNAATDTAKALLQAKLKEASGFSEKKYSFTTWRELCAAMNEAREVAGNAGATPAQLQTVLADVQKKIDALQERPVLPDLGPKIALGASLFATDRTGPVNNGTLLWATADPCDSFDIYRAAGKAGTFTKIYSGAGASFNDYGLKDGAYSYKLVAHRGAETLTSNIAQITTMAMPAGLTEYSNQTGAGAEALSEPLKIGDTYYKFDSKRDGQTVTYTVSTSTDGKNWKTGPVVLDQSSHPDLADYKLESGSLFYDKIHDRIVWWAHWERSKGYNDGRALVATAKPGQPFTVHHIYNPLGVQVRDMSVFVDDNHQGYLVAASNLPGQGANATLTLFQLNADYTDVTGIVNTAMEDEYREAPHIFKTGGFYYLFFSQAAGWFPSRAGYVSARSLDGRWSDVRYVGNPSTFSAQSGPILDFGQGGQHVPALMGYRWVRGEGTSGAVVLPLKCADGFALGDYAPTLLLDAAKGRMIPLDAGKLLSQDQPASASIPGSKDHEVGKAFDGDYATFFQSDDKKWPFSVTTDLGTVCRVRNVQISWFLHKGSEAYYKYTLEGSVDGNEWRVLLDRTDDKNTLVSKTYGFSSDLLPDAPSARYVRITVQGAVLHNNPNNWYSPTLYEVKVYGNAGAKTERVR